MAKRIQETACALCGSLGPGAEYHPLAFCLLAKELGSKAARASINEVLDRGRKLERAGLPNDTPITAPLSPSKKRTGSKR